jgi:uncharacterized C2H2 Zn-finger protein
MGVPLPWSRKRQAMPTMKVAGKQMVLFKVCPTCGTVHEKRSDYCTAGCQSRATYRARAGLPIFGPPMTRQKSIATQTAA